ncbi:cysteine-rich secreted protein [Moniliophthora roreri MCA 2997]|uniref:Cysteine-rich secreted protein n=1 Tax=Moniliophthora roreri (strain MCA 2997) TaxID=1381753 RepID=V2X432_MONRO|nr:cysteine-rich secreted protein [Moniliophthora roreri MCA 2997]
MKFSTVAFFLLPTLIAKSQEIPQCRPGFEPVEFELGSGEYFCRQIVISCPLNETPYKNSETNADLCCPNNQQLVMYDENLKTGACCGADQVYVGIKPNGKCCKKGEVLKDGKCVPAPPPSGCQSCPSQPPDACALKGICGDNINTGLQYGSCYQILFPTGQQMGRGIGPREDQYTQDGYIQICKAPAGSDCGTGPVKSTTGEFVIEDTLGPAGKNNGGRGWMGRIEGTSHMGLTNIVKDVNTFRAKSSCSGCKCLVQLLGTGYACPSYRPGITWVSRSFWKNPKVTLKLQFLETPCDGTFSFPQRN